MDGASQPTDRGRIDWVRLFFSSSGRLGRGPFLIAAAVLLGLFGAYEALVPRALHGPTAWAVHLPLLFSAACLLSKRLHDRGRAGWWAAPVLLAFAIAWPSPNVMFGAPAVIVLAWAAVELGALRSQPQPNRFGPPPS
jgi:uncharacterized membrane protein YhaH (DUF805 family)